MQGGGIASPNVSKLVSQYRGKPSLSFPREVVWDGVVVTAIPKPAEL